MPLLKHANFIQSSIYNKGMFHKYVAWLNNCLGPRQEIKEAIKHTSYMFVSS